MSRKTDEQVRESLRRLHRFYTGEEYEAERDDVSKGGGWYVISSLMLIAALLCILLLLSGCTKSRREGQTVRRWSEHGEQGGVPFFKAGEETIETRETVVTGVDTQAMAGVVTAAVRAAMAAGTGGLGFGVPEVVAGIATTGAGIAAVLQSRKAARRTAEAEAAVVDRDAAWDAEREASIRAAKLEQPPKRA